MTGVVLFGGTTEGRQLAQALDSLCAARGLPLTVFVATEYGQEVLPAEHDRMVGFHPEFLRLRRAARSHRGQ